MPDVVGVAVHGLSLRGVEARVGRNGRCSVLRTGAVELPEATFEAGRLCDGEALTAGLRDLWQVAGFRSKRIRMSIDGRIAVLRRTELPSIGSEKLRQAAGFDIAELLNFPISDAVFDVDEIEHFERNGTTWARALVVAVEESAIDELAVAAGEAGLRFVGTDLVAEALARSVDCGHGDEPVAIVDCEDSITNVVIRDDSGVLFARTLNVGVGETSISVADELESALAQLSGTDDEGSTPVSDATVGVSTVAEGVRGTLNYYSAELDPRPLTNVIVVGKKGHAAGLLASLEQSVAIPVSTASASVPWPDDQPLLGFELPLGIALGASSHGERHLALTSDRQKHQRTRRQRRIASLALSVPLIALLAITGANVHSSAADARDDANRAEEATDLLALRVGEHDDTKLQMSEWRAITRDVQRLDDQRLRFGLVIEELAQAMPDDSRVVNVQLRRAGEEDTPTGYVGPAPIGLVSITGITDDLGGVGRWVNQVDATETVDGLWLDQSTFGPLGADGDVGVIFSVEGIITSAARPIEPMTEQAAVGG